MAYGKNFVPKGGRKLQRMSLMSAATRIGLTVEEYAAHLEADERWCSFHRAWEAKASFYADASKATGVTADCRVGALQRSKARYAAKKAGVA